MAYGPEGFDRGNWGLSEMPQVAIRNGFVFGNLDPDAPSLDEYMGDYGWYFDLYSRRTEGGIEVVGLPQRWVLHANWKVLAENFMGDAYHSPTSHKSVVEIGLSGVAKDRSKQSAIHYNANGIGGGGLMRTEPSYEGYSPEVQAAMRAWLDPAHREVTDDRGFMPVSGLMFPTLAFLCVSAVVESGGDAVPFLTIRAMRPLNAGSIEMISWFAVDREASPEFRDKSMRAYSASFGSAGMFEQDDAENWASVTRAARGIGAADHRINVRMGLDSAGEPIVPPLGDWPGPGTAYPVPFAEHNARVFWSTWLRYMTAGEDA
jgi:phenylpropionate dioxygenase-like ring-hydroxylating dioxygenase large terminal subunit